MGRGEEVTDEEVAARGEKDARVLVSHCDQSTKLLVSPVLSCFNFPHDLIF